MTMTCHVLHAGDGYTYLTNHIAAGDAQRSAHDPLVDYYTAAGNPPGVWIGSGVAELGMSGDVGEEHMLALFGEGLHPDANALITARIAAGMPYREALESVRLGRRFYQYSEPNIPLVGAVRRGYEEFEKANERRPSVEERRAIKQRVAADLLTGPDGTRPAPELVRAYITDELGKARQPVAGFDLVFSPVKSVSLLWALGGPVIRRIVWEAHEAGIRAALAYMEREAGFTRVGKNGIAQIDTSGFVAVAFTHYDSRAGDPDLHTHVGLANRVLAADGQWRTLDSQQVHRVAVSGSEIYNATVEQVLTGGLGAAWIEVSKRAGRRAVREIDGIPIELITGFSRRSTQVEQGYDRLVADYVTTYGHTPPRSVQMKLAQQATLTERPDKHTPKPLAELTSEWRDAAARMLPGQDIDAVIAGVLNRASTPAVAGLGPVEVADTAARVVDVVSGHRATWTVYHVRAEAIRQLKPIPFTSMAAREAAIEQVVTAALDTGSIELAVTVPDVPAPPVLLRRANGESVFHRRGSTRYTSHTVLEAETRLLDAAREPAGPVVALPAVRAAIARYQADTGRTLDAGQRELVEQFVARGRAIAVGIGPPGTGKSTAMRVVRTAWETTGGRVLGLAPSAAAASVLGDQLGVRAYTLHSLVKAHEDGGGNNGGADGGIDVRAGDMLLVDEAGMAGTRLLDRVRAIAAERGAVVRLVGDYRQLAAVEAGGALRLLHCDVGGTELSTVHRFRDPAEAAAVLALRVGALDAVAFYAARARLHGGPRAAVLDQLYAAWRADTQAGHTAIMISDSTEVARELSARAQTERRALGLAEAGGVLLHDDTVAGRGDRIVTRYNARRLAVLGGHDYVKNGDLWEVLERHPNGALTVRHTRHRGRITLPPGYVAEHVELGYAATIHRSQGLTVEVSHAYLSPMAVREAALVALSRGILANHAWLDTETVLDPDEPEVLPGDLFYRHRAHDPAEAAFAAIVRREGAEPSATEHLRAALAEPYRLDVVVPQYLHALTVYRGPEAAAEAAEWARQALPDRAADIIADPAWPTLAQVLHEISDAGADPVTRLAQRAAEREFEDDPHSPARSAAQVLHYRLAEDLPTAPTAPADGQHRPRLLPGWVPTPPEPEPGLSAELAELGSWLRERAEAIADRVRYLGEQAAEHRPAWGAHLGPVPHNPLERGTWIDRAGQVAAYRERFAGSADDPALLPGGMRGEAARARTWVHHYLASTPPSGRADRASTPANRTHRPAGRGDQGERRKGIEEAWRARPHGHLTGRELAAAIAEQRRRAEQATDRQEAAARRLAEVEPQVADGRGPRARAVEHLRRQASELTARAEQARATNADLVAEQQLRATMPAEQKALELRLRTIRRSEQREQDRADDAVRPVQHADPPRHGRPHEPPHSGRSTDRGLT